MALAWNMNFSIWAKLLFKLRENLPTIRQKLHAPIYLFGKERNYFRSWISISYRFRINAPHNVSLNLNDKKGFQIYHIISAINQCWVTKISPIRVWPSIWGGDRSLNNRRSSKSETLQKIYFPSIFSQSTLRFFYALNYLPRYLLHKQKWLFIYKNCFEWRKLYTEHRFFLFCVVAAQSSGFN